VESVPAAGTATAKKSGNFKKKTKGGGDQKGQKPRTNTGSFGPVKKVAVMGETEQ
jgi:hypothetical protein